MRQPSNSILGKETLKLSGKQGNLSRENGMEMEGDIISKDLGTGAVALAGQSN